MAQRQKGRFIKLANISTNNISLLQGLPEEVSRNIGQFNESALLPLCYPCIQFYLLSSKGSVLYINQKYIKITCSSLALFIYLFILFPLFYWTKTKCSFHIVK